MGRNKAKDDEFFNCSQEHEFDYVANLYSDSDEVKSFLKEKCVSNEIKYSKNKEVYALIEQELGYSIPEQFITM